jgi:hypothetical protein
MTTYSGANKRLSVAQDIEDVLPLVRRPGSHRGLTRGRPLHGLSGGQPRSCSNRQRARRNHCRGAQDAVAVRRIVQLLALAGQRREEVVRASPGEIDAEARTWCIPAYRTKNGTAHIVHNLAHLLAKGGGRPAVFDWRLRHACGRVSNGCCCGCGCVTRVPPWPSVIATKLPAM